MPALAPAPALRLTPGGSEIELPSISFFGRSLAEYARFFALDLAALKGRDVLDVAAGPSSFTTEACARKVNAVAVDPLYGCPPAELATHVRLDYERMFAQMRAKPRLFKVGAPVAAAPAYPSALNPGGGGTAGPVFSPSIDAAEIDRRGAAQRFLADYETQFFRNRYVAGSLPRLPFFDGTFDVVLCAHLLFTYARRFDFDWHLAACRELVRVSADEVRLHPLCGLDGKPYAGLPRLRRELRGHGIASSVVVVDYAFFAGANSMLVLKRAVAE
ncbi:MAG: class I SAM-dependent methyltransferase [Opitutus sp.]|nr:class I SAM-dependent methyltransferase [Opitutus sp.]